MRHQLRASSPAVRGVARLAYIVCATDTGNRWVLVGGQQVEIYENLYQKGPGIGCLTLEAHSYCFPS